MAKAKFQSKAPGLTIHVEEKERKVGTRTVLTLVKIQFSGNVFETDKPEEITFLRQHTGLGKDYWEITQQDESVVKKAQENPSRR